MKQIRNREMKQVRNNLPMRVEMIFTSESLATMGTLEWFQASVNKLMFNTVWTISESTPTDLIKLISTLPFNQMPFLDWDIVLPVLAFLRTRHTFTNVGLISFGGFGHHGYCIVLSLAITFSVNKSVHIHHWHALINFVTTDVSI